MLAALVFDFDGLILDTETPLYEAWSRTFRHYGAQPISTSVWGHHLGRDDRDPRRIDPLTVLQDQLDQPLDVDEVHHLRRRWRDELLDAQAVLPGVEALLDAARSLGAATAIASSSPVDWVEHHLGTRSLLDRFDAVACAGDGLAGKPAPDTYLRACELVGAAPAASVALEDSPNGVRAAKRAGLRCIAVPTPLSAGLDYSMADELVPSLTAVDLHRLSG